MAFKMCLINQNDAVQKLKKFADIHQNKIELEKNI